MKIAALFGGQGSQYPGMGKNLREESAAARQVYECAGDILGFDVAKASDQSSEEELAQTRMAQPVIFTHSLAAFSTARDHLPLPEATAGHSLGEYAALCCAGCFSIEDGFRIIAARAQVMEEAAGSAPGAMVAILGSNPEAVETVCARYENVWAVNYNLPNQTVISGETQGCLGAARELEKAGARTTRLAVSSAFHTPLMERAAQQLKEKVQDIAYAPPRWDFYSNLTGEKLVPEDFPDYFARHMVSPVLFTRQVAAMAANGVEACVEFGPKRTASTLSKKNCRSLAVFQVEDMETFKKTIEALA